MGKNKTINRLIRLCTSICVMLLLNAYIPIADANEWSASGLRIYEQFDVNCDNPQYPEIQMPQFAERSEPGVISKRCYICSSGANVDVTLFAHANGFGPGTQAYLKCFITNACGDFTDIKPDHVKLADPPFCAYSDHYFKGNIYLPPGKYAMKAASGAMSPFNCEPQYGYVIDLQPEVSIDRKPLILVHGWQFKGDYRCSKWIYPLAENNSTFGDMAKWFQEIGYDVWIANYNTGDNGTPPIEINAQCLKDQFTYVRKLYGQKPIVIAHSLGGLISRACLNLDTCRDNVTALYTLGSPHAGSNTLRVLLPLLGQICQRHPVAYQVSMPTLFNIMNPNRDGIDYHFIGGTATPGIQGRLMELLDGINDGVVGNHSAVGWSLDKANVISGPEAGRYWTEETHSSGLAYPSYFEASGEDDFGNPRNESQAFRCIAWRLNKGSQKDCEEVTQDLSMMRVASPVSATTVDVNGHLTSGQSANHTLQVDSTGQALFYLSWVEGSLSFTLTRPDGQIITPTYADDHPEVVTYTTGLGDDAILPYAGYRFTNTIPGLYTLTIEANSTGNESTDYLAFVELETNRTFSVTANAKFYQAGDTATFTGTLLGPAGGIAGADVEVHLTRADGNIETLMLKDVGGGVYQSSYTIPDVAGYLQGTFTAVGDDRGVAFTRQVNDLFAIGTHTAQLSGTYADRFEDEDGDDFHDTLAVDVGITVTKSGTYALSADLAVGDQTVAHAVHYDVLSTGTQTVTLHFDTLDIFRSQVSGPYRVTHLYLVDLSAGGIPVEIADDVWVTTANN